MDIDLMEIIAECVRHTLEIEGLDPNDDEHVDMVLDKLYDNPNFINSIKHCFKFKCSFSEKNSALFGNKD